MVTSSHLSRLVDALCKNKHLVEVDLGIFDDQGLGYFADHLDKVISLKYITIEESCKHELS